MGGVSVIFILQHSELSKVIGEPLPLSLDEGASIIDAIKLVDEEILRRATKFPVTGYRSLLQMVYHPMENRFYRQVSIQGYADLGSFINLREEPTRPLPKRIIVILVPEGSCCSDWEDVVDG